MTSSAASCARFHRVLRALHDYPGRVGCGCFRGFAKRAWPEETATARTTLRLGGYSRCAGAMLAKLGRLGLARFVRGRGNMSSGWEITGAGREELRRYDIQG